MLVSNSMKIASSKEIGGWKAIATVILALVVFASVSERVVSVSKKTEGTRIHSQIRNNLLI